jgi:anti-sigma factor RsiW
MDPESFNELALRVIAGEATPEERAALERELAGNASRSDEFAQLRMTYDVLGTAAPMTEAASATGPELPAHRVGELRTAVRQHFGPVAARKKSEPVLDAFRWLFAGGGLVGLAAIVVLLCFANRTVEVGLYSSDLERVRGEQGLFAQGASTAKLVTFEQDAPFDAWQKQSLAWYEHAKIWVDNEHDVLHIVRRIDLGHVVQETQPLAASNEAQRAQIQQAVQDLGR